MATARPQTAGSLRFLDPTDRCDPSESWLLMARLFDRFGSLQYLDSFFAQP